MAGSGCACADKTASSRNALIEASLKNGEAFCFSKPFGDSRLGFGIRDWVEGLG
jgi:hypothetical protein